MKIFGLYDTNIQLFITFDFYTDILFKSLYLFKNKQNKSYSSMLFCFFLWRKKLEDDILY